MAKNTAQKSKRNDHDDLEEVSEDEYSSADTETYYPQAEDQDLEVDESAYRLLEYIDLDWPAQSIAINGNKLYVGTNPDEENYKDTNLVEITLFNHSCTDIRFKKNKINTFINKIRFNENIYAISDDCLSVYATDLNLIREIKGNFGYALHVTDDRVYTGTSNGYVEVFDHSLRSLSKFKVHDKAIDSISVMDNIIFTGSQDHSLKMTDLNGNAIKSIKNKSDVNCLDVIDNKLVFGDDDGVIHLLDTRTDSKEEIAWHKTSISAIKWKDSDVFVSGSDEQLCIWDTNMEEEWEYHKYLLFVHQGQKFYKDCVFYENKVISTSQDGICVFTPLSFDSE